MGGSYTLARIKKPRICDSATAVGATAATGSGASTTTSFENIRVLGVGDMEKKRMSMSDMDARELKRATL